MVVRVFHGDASHPTFLRRIAQQDTIRQTFGECGDVKSVRFAEDRETGEFRGFGHVEFYDGSCVDAAIELAGSDVMGRPIRVSSPHARDILSSSIYFLEIILLNRWLILFF